MKIEKFIGVFAVLLVVFFLIILGKWIFLKNDYSQIQYQKISEVAQDKEDKPDAETTQEAGNPEDATPAVTENGGNAPGNTADLAERFVTDVIQKDNVNEKALWNATNMNGVYIATIKLESKPYENTLLVWTGLGLLPVSAYNYKNGAVSLIMMQTKDEFIANNNFINIRYISREN